MGGILSRSGILSLNAVRASSGTDRSAGTSAFGKSRIIQVDYERWDVGVLELNLVEQLVSAAVEWRQTSDHLKNDGSETPPVNRLSMPLFEQYLRRQILRSPTYRERIALGHEHLGQAEIRQPNKALCVNKHIFWFEVSIDDILLVQVLQSEYHLCSEKLRLLFGKSALFGEQPEELASWTVVQYEKQFFGSLKGKVKLDDEWVVNLHQDVPLRLNVELLLFLLDVFFLEYFHGVEAVAGLLPHQDDLGVAALAKDLEQSEIVHRHSLHLIIMIMNSSPQVRITRYEMRTRQKKALLTLSIKTPHNEFYLQIDVQKFMINLTLFLNIQSLSQQISPSLAKHQTKKSETYKMGDSIYIQRQLFFAICDSLKGKLKDYGEFVEGMNRVVQEVNCRTCFLDREEEKRNRSVEGDSRKIDQEKTIFDRFVKKFNILLTKQYEIDTKESFNELFQRVEANQQITKSIGSVMQIRFSKLKSKYMPFYKRLAKMEGASQPTSTALSPGITSLYVVRTDLQTSIDGQSYNIVKVGKTNKSIIDYEKCLYEDYKNKILFQYVYLGIFHEQKGKVIDHFFHDRLVKIPVSKYFIFNYTDFEENTRVSQQFYLLTEEFVTEMQILIKDYCSKHSQPHQ